MMLPRCDWHSGRNENTASAVAICTSSMSPAIDQLISQRMPTLTTTMMAAASMTRPPAIASGRVTAASGPSRTGAPPSPASVIGLRLFPLIPAQRDIDAVRDRAFDQDADIRFRIKHEVPIFNRPFSEITKDYTDLQRQRLLYRVLIESLLDESGLRLSSSGSRRSMPRNFRNSSRS